MKIISYLGTLSGKLGGFVASRNRGGAYLRAHTIPVNPQTTLQTTVRERLGSLAKRWRDVLTEAQRADWKNLADQNPSVDRQGKSLVLGGNNLYTGSNITLLTAGNAIIDDAPATMENNGLLTGELQPVTAGSTTITVDFSADCESYEKIYIKGVLDIPQSVNNIQNRLRFMFASPAAAVSPLTVDIPSSFGLPTAGTKVAVNIHKLNVENGSLSPGILSFADVT